MSSDFACMPLVLRTDHSCVIEYTICSQPRPCGTLGREEIVRVCGGGDGRVTGGTVPGSKTRRQYEIEKH